MKEPQARPGSGAASGSARLLGKHHRGVFSCLAGAGRPYLYCPQYWVTHSPSEAQGRWKQRSQPLTVQVMVAPRSPQTKHC